MTEERIALSPARAREAEIKITRLPLRQVGRITRLEGGRSVWERLQEVGLHVGDRVSVIREAPLRGPLLVECNGHEIAISRSIAAKIFVKVIA